MLRALPDECGPSSATFESWREPSWLAGVDGDEKPLSAEQSKELLLRYALARWGNTQ